MSEARETPTDDERERLRIIVGTVLTNVSNFPEKVQARLLGQDMLPLIERVTEAVAAGWRRQEPDTTQWEYGIRASGDDEPYSDISEDVDWLIDHWALATSDEHIVRRRPAGPWEPVEVAALSVRQPTKGADS